jgi:hypothetical protein
MFRKLIYKAVVVFLSSSLLFFSTPNLSTTIFCVISVYQTSDLLMLDKQKAGLIDLLEKFFS